MRIQHNIMAMNAYRNYNNNVSALSKNLEKLSSGYRINRAGDDAAGLAISEKMRAQITGLDAAQKNVKDGISLVKTAEGAMQEVQDMLNRMVYLATQSANGTYDNEVDRANLQKEVDSLRSEINRIADSANFNGIKLLDGSLGLNEAAFTIGDPGAVAAAGNTDITLALGTVAGATAHETTLGNTQAAPSFTIDLGDVALSAATGGDNSAQIVVAGATMETAANLGTGAMTTTEIRDAILANKDDWTSKGKTSGNVKIGDFEFKVEASGTTGLKFTYAGMNASTTPATTDKYTAGQATALNGLLGSAVTYTGTAGTGATATGDIQHNTMDVVQAKAETLNARAGIDLTVDATLVADGNKLTIDGKTFVFKTKEDSTVEAADGEQLIDVSDFAADKQIEAAIDELSKYKTTNFDIESKNATTLHIDQKVGNTDEYKEADLKALFSAKTPGTAQGTSLTVADNSKILEGNSLTIGEKTYTFGEGDGQVAIGTTAAETLTNLKTKLEADGIASEVQGTDKLIVYANANGVIPAITGGGLTLQIGDTSDPWNQLKVAVEDIHTDALGIAEISILDQDSAAAAVNVIKNAINSVSMTRGTLGATQNRLEHTANNLSVMEENITDAESTIRDTDVADEMMVYTKNNILIQSAQAMLAQANAVPQGVLQLLQ